MTRAIGSSRPVLAAAAALVAAVFLSACAGTVIDREKLQGTVQSSLESSIHEKIRGVDCPSQERVDPGATFTCAVIFSDDKRGIATLKIRNQDADISMIGFKATK